MKPTEENNLQKLYDLVSDETSAWLKKARRRRKYRWFYNIKAHIHLKYLRIKRKLGLRK